MRRIGLAISLVVGGALAAGLVLRAEQEETVRAAGGSPPPAAVFTPSASAPAVPAVGALGPAFVSENQLRPTGDAGQSKVWFHDGRWWGILLAGGEFRIHAFDPATGWTDTGTLADPRSTSHVDVLAEGDTVLVVGAGRSASAANAVEIRRFRYDAAGRLYAADRSFPPVRINSTGATHVTLARAADGSLWSAFVTDQRLQVAHSTNGDGGWSDPAPIPVAVASEPIDAASIAASSERVTVLAATASGSVVALSTEDGDRWRSHILSRGSAPDVERVVALRAGPPSGQGPEFVALAELAPVDTDPNALAPHLVVYATEDGESWSSHAVSRIEDRLSDPTLILDEGTGSVTVVAASEGSILSKSAPFDRLVFPSGRGLPVLRADVGGVFRQPTGPKLVPGNAGLLVLAADSGIGRYGHGSIGVPAIEGGPGRSDVAVLLADDFDDRSVEDGPAPGWQLGSDTGTGELGLTDGLEGKALRLTSTQVGSARGCRRFVVSVAAPLRISQAFRIAGGGAGDAVVASLRGAGETASVRVDDRGRVAWFDGAEKRVGRSVAPATWYRLELRVDPASRTYSFTVSDPAGASVAGATGVAWRTDQGDTPDQLCFSTRDGVGAEVVIDDIEVLR